MQLDDLLDAIEDNDLEAVNVALNEHKVDINGVDDEGFTPLMLAAHLGEDVILETLLEQKANVNIVSSEDGSDALMCAVQGGFEHCVQILIDVKANVNVVHEGNVNPLYSAAQEGHTRIVRKLIKCKANVNATCNNKVSPLFIASQENHVSVVQILMSAKSDVNLFNKSRTTPLFIAVQKANTDVVKSLIKRSQKGNINLDMEICTKKGLTPLLEAIKHGHFEECKLLIGARADVNNPSEIDGMTPLMTASIYGDIDVVEELVIAGADVDVLNDDGEDAATILKREYGEDLQKIIEEHQQSLPATSNSDKENEDADTHHDHHHTHKHTHKHHHTSDDKSTKQTKVCKYDRSGHIPY